MFYRQINVANANNKAFTLVELLLSLTLGTVLLFSLSGIYRDQYQIQQYQKEKLHLQKQAKQLLDYFHQHIQHSGFQGGFRQQSNFPLFLNQNQSINLVNKHCVILFYDLNNDGCIGNRNKKQDCQINQLNMTKELSKEIFGFKLFNQELYIFEDNSLQDCVGKLCQSLLTQCSKGKWRKSSDRNYFKIIALTFSFVNSKKLIEVNLELQSSKYRNIIYQSKRYVYILNGEE